MFVKVCGVRTAADVEAVVAAGADAVGFVLTASVRRVEAEWARELAAAVPPGVLTVGVAAGVPAAEAARLALVAGVQALQLHGDYPREAFAELADQPFRLIRATALTGTTELTTGAYGEDYLLLDSPVAGSGERWDLTPLARTAPTGPWLLAGGLTPANVTAAITAAHPWGVDVSSGVEATRGVKDHALIHEFVAKAKAA
ncbi:phosphoribosylanthranilate isomerase [Kitasatospora sp. MMS16-BH015]|uniref:phosphoribosylanthranilate isomerase n=1 Tax=Kitasatospora sp. MMS16-BH015 TaxID=2018025 RepID=UPI000CA38A64|nr:phosphoribosylanthranilate isomerase [Kitasatospora sp. MMS16-BH015]AUG78185.1 phosphoribosylanthranilate isomerase [Kitasatospora sp. MMS16-BH015]